MLNLKVTNQNLVVCNGGGKTPTAAIVFTTQFGYPKRAMNICMSMVNAQLNWGRPV